MVGLIYHRSEVVGPVGGAAVDDGQQHREFGEVGVGHGERVVLDRCATVDEAVELARTTPVAASSSLTLAGRSEGRAAAATVELSPAGSALLRPEQGGFLLRSNHFVDPELARGETFGTEDPDTYHRRAALQQRTASLAAPDRDALVRVLTCHADQGAELCCHVEPGAPLGKRWETLATVALDVADGRLAVHAGGPCTLSNTAWTEVG